MIDMTGVSAISNSLNMALNISKAMLGIRDQAMIQEKVVELTSQIIAAQQGAITANSAQSSLLERIRELEEELVKLKTWETEKKRYALRQIWESAFAYMPKAGMEDSEPPHWLCHTCYQQARKSFLTSSSVTGRDSIWSCASCPTTMRIPSYFYPGSPNQWASPNNPKPAVAAPTANGTSGE
jgi:hypothetical protein